MITPEQFDEIRKYTSPNSLLVIGPRGLRRIYTPFLVLVKANTAHFKANTVQTVTRVGLGKEGGILFVIHDRSFGHSLFLIQ